MTQIVAEKDIPFSRARLKKRAAIGLIFVIWSVFVALNLRHIFEPFRDTGKPLAGEPFYAIRAQNYLRHGYINNWFGVCNNLNPHPDRLTFKFTEMPAYFVVNSLSFRLFGIKTSSFRMVELGYALLFFVLFSLGTRKVFDDKTAVLASVFMLLLPVNMFLLYISWVFLFPLAALFSYALWERTRSKTYYSLTILSLALGCLHYIAGFIVVPALILHGAVKGSLKKNLRPLAGIVAAAVFLGLAYLLQILLLGQNMETVVGKAFWESILNLEYLKYVYVINMPKLVRNYNDFLTMPVLLLSAYWTARKAFSKESRNSGDGLIFLLLLFPLIFFLMFLGMVASHLHFLTLFGPFLSLSCARALLEWKPLPERYGRVRQLAILLFLGCLALISYRVQRKFDLMLWSPGNARGYAIASELREMLGEEESVAGVSAAGYGHETMSPAFHFYLQRNYYGNISNLERLQSLRGRNVALFLLPVAGEAGPAERELGAYLRKNYPFYGDPSRRKMLVFDLRESHLAQSESKP